MKVLIATHNLGKINEFKKILSSLGFEFLTLNDFEKVEEPTESGRTLNENSLLKAKYYYNLFKCPVIADDTGLFIEDLNGEPGINTARYSGSGDKENRKLVLEKLNGKRSSAYFETILTYYDGENVITASGLLNGQITTFETGEYGFGYDSIFYLPKFKQTIAEMTQDVKNKISHRFIAMSNLKRKIECFVNPTLEIDYVKQKIYSLFNEEILVIDKIPGGMSNNTYHVKTVSNDVTVRVPGVTSELFVGRYLEYNSLQKVQGDESFVQTIYFELCSGFKVSPYIIKEREEYQISEIAESLEKFHRLPKFSNDFKPFERFLYYERLVNILDVQLNEGYYNLKDKILTYKDLLVKREMMSCHNDAQLSNYVITKDCHILIDFEFTGNNDPFFDYACLGNNDLDIGKSIACHVLNRPLTTHEDMVIELWYSLQALSWYLVAMFKYATGMNKTSGLDFNEIATYFLLKAENLLKKY